jgi:hypothetical protein
MEAPTVGIQLGDWCLSLDYLSVGLTKYTTGGRTKRKYKSQQALPPPFVRDPKDSFRLRLLVPFVS